MQKEQVSFMTDLFQKNKINFLSDPPDKFQFIRTKGFQTSHNHEN
jgi:hypothetical protein